MRPFSWGEPPVVAVTGPDRGGDVAWQMARVAVLRAGGAPVRVCAKSPLDRPFDALVLGGGADIDPELYGGHGAKTGDVVREARAEVETGRAPRSSVVLAPAIFLARKVFEAHTRGPDLARDALERRMAEEALAADVPLLGLCRGAQLLNVVLGGTLHADITDLYVETPQIRTVLPKKTVTITAGSRLAEVLGAGPCAVNALHHQAVHRLGRGLSIVAREANGIVQAVEDPARRFCIGVQWHPEYLPQVPRQQALFRALVEAARERGATRSRAKDAA